MPFEKGNNLAQEWSIENATPRFQDALKFAREDDECLCMQDAVAHSGIPSRTFYYLACNHDVLQEIKQDIADAIVSRVNRKGLIGDFNATMSIWRMKQLGEKDEQHVKTSNVTKSIIEVTDNETKEEVDKLIDKFENE